MFDLDQPGAVAGNAGGEARRGNPILWLAGFQFVALVAFGWWTMLSAHPPAREDMVEPPSHFQYVITSQEWTKAPTFRQIAERHRLHVSQFAATLNVNGGPDTHCADADAPLVIGAEVKIVLDPDGSTDCRDAAEPGAPPPESDGNGAVSLPGADG